MAEFGTFIYTVLTEMHRALVLKMFWSWFIVTTFGAVSLTLPQAYGLIVIASLVLPYTSFSPEKDMAKIAERLTYSNLLIVSTLLFGYITTFFL